MAERYMIPYNRKIWSFNLRKMGTYWVEGKMPLVSLDDVLRSLILREAEEKEMPHASFYYPRRGGFQTFVNALAGRVPRLFCGTEIYSVERKNRTWVLNGTEKYDLVVSTVSLKEMPALFHGALPDKVLRAIEALRYNSLTVTLCKSESPFDYSWMYLPSLRLKAHRLIFQSNLSAMNSPRGKQSISVETIGKWNPERQVSELQKERIRDLDIGEIIGSHHTQYAYMIFDEETPRHLRTITDYFRPLRFKRLGRFAEWGYFNMDVCMKRAFHLTKEIQSEKHIHRHARGQ
jgi:protoporphyrinogen oxidase